MNDMDFSEFQHIRTYNFHSHTQFCDGKAPMEEFVREAVRQRFTHYGFSPHSPLPLRSPCNMSQSDVPAYFAEVDRLRAAYGDKIKLYAGMEIDYLGPQWGPAHPYFDSIPLDYRIGSVHFIPNPEERYIDIDGRYENFRGKMEQYFYRDIRYVVDTFYRQSIDMVEAGGFDILGHLDKVGHNAAHYSPGIEDESWYVRLVDMLIDAVVASGVTVEVNTKAWQDHRRMFPSTRYLSRLISAGVPILVNSDAHFPSLINSSRAIAYSILDETASATN